jgi:hypothetical protein
LISPCFLDEFVFRMARASNNHGLLVVGCSKELTNLVGGLIAIHDGHAAVHEDKAVLELALLLSCLDGFIGF